MTYIPGCVGDSAAIEYTQMQRNGVHLARGSSSPGADNAAAYHPRKLGLSHHSRGSGELCAGAVRKNPLLRLEA